MPARLALIHNPHSRLNLRDGDQAATAARSLLGPLFVTPATRAELAEEIRKLSSQDVQILAVNGGDGTVSDVLTAVLECWPRDRLPTLAILPSGNTNLIASDVGCGLRGLPAVRALLERLKAGTITDKVEHRHPVVVSWPGAPGRSPVAGMFCGLAAFTRAIEQAHNPAILNRYSHDTAVLVTVLWSIRQLFSRETRSRWLNGTPMTLTRDGGAPDCAPRFLFLCTGLRRLSHGIWPFWDSTGSQGGLTWLDILAPPPRLLRNLICVARGRISGALRNSPSYRSGRASELLIRAPDHLVMDGEELAPEPDELIRLSAGPAIAFIRL